ncbi:SRPBCC family protein [Jannaschia seohaensis]|uniref:Polyketide cyclase / dehydrase and lipid transport n=1 Tax=Jannaschia seohaensis TaxID=475081 RepID=A0A2Y9AII6_9RHOB|nr:SRPBCC family protein [Jannaschia seohaensis]PWJ20276.1 polyketide cyclase/dehydrase/lipid transport protein [Jannaschia seohaensis]SSA44291.1 Polyketide cyclase / dehydrase and lipid transport [Jannaschia seohaensis]
MSFRSSRLLRLALAFNLAFSTLCGLSVLVLGPAAVGAALGPFPGWFMAGLGIGLLGFAALIGFALWRLRVGLALLISGLDVLWVIGTLPMAIVPGFLTSQGQLVVAGVAAVVGLACILQLAGIRALLRDPKGAPNTFKHCVRLTSGADPDTLWPVIRDLGSIARYGTGLKSSRLEGAEEPAPGAVRVCTNHNDQSWAEEVVSLDDATRSFVLRFRAEAEDFPFPFAAMTGGWSVSPAPEGSVVDIWWTVRPKHRHLGWLLLAVATIPLDRDIRHLVAAMEAGGASTSRTAAVSLPAFAYC